MGYYETDRDWEHFGHKDPHWGVLADERFHRDKLDEAALDEFYATGEEYIQWVFDTVQSKIDEHFSPIRSLDFGCGVGRLVIPLARRSKESVGVDISDGMLAEARAYIEKKGIGNITLAKSSDTLSSVTGTFDLVNSYIVLQHISANRGLLIFKRLLELLNKGGIGVLHFTYSKSTIENPLSTWPSSLEMKSYLTPVKLLQHYIVNLRLGAEKFARRALGKNPMIQMNAYVLNPIFHLLQTSGISSIHVELTHHGDDYGVILFFKKPL